MVSSIDSLDVDKSERCLLPNLGLVELEVDEDVNNDFLIWSNGNAVQWKILFRDTKKSNAIITLRFDFVLIGLVNIDVVFLASFFI